MNAFAPHPLLLALLGLLAGCAVGPDYHRPSQEIPAAFRATPATAAQAWPSDDWWRGFNSPELNQLIDDARVNNFDIQAAIARVEQADAQVRIAGAPLLPTVDANGGASWSRSFSRRSVLSSGGYTESRQYQAGASISYELDFWGKLRDQQQAAEATAQFSRFDQQTVALTAVTSVADSWFQALSLQDRLDIAHHNLDAATDILKAIQAQMAAGIASQLDVAQQATLVANVRAQIPALQSQLEQELIGLGILTGHPPEDIKLRPGSLSKGSLTALTLPAVAPGLPSELLARRPDVASAEAQLISANANIRAARAAFFPDVSLSASGGWQNLALSTLFGPGSLFASAAASVTQTIFDNGAKGGAYDQAKGSYDELLADYKKAVVQAFTDVDNAVTAYRYATDQETLGEAAVASAQQAADISRSQLVAGTANLVTSLQAQQTLFSDLDSLAQLRLARVEALLSIYKALGGGWQQSDVQAPPSTIFHGIL